jgi:hypothetical protein
MRMQLSKVSFARWSRLTAVVLLAIGVLPVMGAPTQAGPVGQIYVETSGYFALTFWPPDSTVTLSFADELGSPQCTGLPPVTVDATGHYVSPSLPCDWEPGWTITATDGVSVSTLVVEDLQLLFGSGATDTVTVHLAVADASDYSFGCGGAARVGIASGDSEVAVRYLDGPGTSVLDFSAPTACPDDDVGPGGSDTADLVDGSMEVVWHLNDVDGDINAAVLGLPFPTTDVGLVDVSAGEWHLRDSNTGEMTSFFYGNPGDLPISGDWDGDGDSTPGLYRQSDGFFYARNSNDQGIADAECFAGDPADIPLVGDWDGDGDDNLGIYRPSEQMFYLFTITCTGSPMGAAQISFLFGNPGDKPVAGDWDGDGIDEVGLHRETTGFFYWRNTLDTGIASGEIFFGDPGDRFVSGDWGVIDYVDTPAVFRPTAHTFYFRHTLTQGIADFEFGSDDFGAGWLPVSGLFGLS